MTENILREQKEKERGVNMVSLLGFWFLLFWFFGVVSDFYFPQINRQPFKIKLTKKGWFFSVFLLLTSKNSINSTQNLTKENSNKPK